MGPEHAGASQLGAQVKALLQPIERVKVKGVTIDAVTTRDMDDAVWVEKLSDGWRVDVSIADVAARVDVGSELDVRAREMTATRYFASGNSPMLPRDLSEDALSLRAGRTRDVLVFRIDLDADLSRRRVDVFLGRLKSSAKLSYAEIPKLLADKTAPFHAFALVSRELTRGLLEARRRAGALALYDLNNGWVTTEEGFIRRIESHEANWGYIIIQELMILANAAAAAWAVERDVPVIFRNHVARAAAPDRDALLADLDSALTMPMQSLELLRERTHMLLSRAEYGVHVRGHYGLNLPAYLHATSPIRRFADLANHRQIRAYILGAELPYSTGTLLEHATHVNVTLEAERERTAAAMKARAEGAARRAALDPRKLDAIGPKEIERVVKLEVRSGEDVGEVLAGALARRAVEGRLPLVCQCVVLAEALKLPGWDALRAEILAAMARRPEDAVSILAMATQTAGWPEPVYACSMTGPSHAPTFRASASFVDGSGSADGDGPAQARAKQRAALALLATRVSSRSAGERPESGNTLDFQHAVIERTRELESQGYIADQARVAFDPDSERSERSLVSSANAVSTKSEARVRSGEARVTSGAAYRFDPGKDPIMQLMEYGQATGAAPDFIFEQAGPPHAPTMTCTGSIAGVVRTANAGSKKDAKRLAAKALIEVLAANVGGGSR